MHAHIYTHFALIAHTHITHTDTYSHTFTHTVDTHTALLYSDYYTPYAQDQVCTMHILHYNTNMHVIRLQSTIFTQHFTLVLGHV